MRVVFLGTPEAAVPPLQTLIDSGHEVSLAVTRPDRPVGRSRKPVPPPVKRTAIEHGIPVFQPRKVRDAAFRERLSAPEPDVLIVVAYGRILPGDVLRIGRYRAINLHFSLLPLYRGAAPVQWALARGESVTGVTTMCMNETLDAGDLLLQQELPVAEGEHAPELMGRLAHAGADLLLRTLEGLERGSVAPTEQDHARATEAPPLDRADGEIAPSLDAREIEGRIRGFDPWPGVWLGREGRRVRLREGRALPGGEPAQPPGTLIESLPEGLTMACGNATRLLITELQFEGRAMLRARDAVNGRLLGPGDRLVSVSNPG